MICFIELQNHRWIKSRTCWGKGSEKHWQRKADHWVSFLVVQIAWYRLQDNHCQERAMDWHWRISTKQQFHDRSRLAPEWSAWKVVHLRMEESQRGDWVKHGHFWERKSFSQRHRLRFLRWLLLFVLDLFTCGIPRKSKENILDPRGQRSWMLCSVALYQRRASRCRGRRLPTVAQNQQNLGLLTLLKSKWDLGSASGKSLG